MTCAHCHRDVAAGAAFCPACGAAQAASADPSWGARRLVRIPSEQRIAGVCAGLADYFDVDVSLVRALWLALSIVPGAIVGGVLAYALAWAVMPEGRSSRATIGRRLVRSTTNRKVAGVCGGLAEYFGVDATVVRVAWIVLSVLPGAVVGGMLAYLAAWFIIPKAPTVVREQQPQAA
ncbi:MAG TPA: PspC domain-containing protein [Vicinamibacterales bacterium]|nr:PspC domain-containing protein [Vicinamibacterales bacterium]